jgi:hypothetical protein
MAIKHYNAISFQGPQKYFLKLEFLEFLECKYTIWHPGLRSFPL